MTKEEADYKRFCTLYDRYIKILQDRSKLKYPTKVEELSKMRSIPLAVLEDAGVFYIGDSTELVVANDPEILELLPEFGVISRTNKAPIFHNRWIFPIKNIDGSILSLSGYTNTESERYIYAVSRFYSRLDDFFGMEKLPLAYQKGYVLLTEGITDALAYRGIGIEVSLAMCGTRSSTYKQMLFDRLKHGVIRVHDRDFAGRQTRQTWNFKHSKTLVTPYGFKDSAQILEHTDWRVYFEEIIPLVIKKLIEDPKLTGDEMIYI